MNTQTNGTTSTPTQYKNRAERRRAEQEAQRKAEDAAAREMHERNPTAIPPSLVEHFAIEAWKRQRARKIARLLARATGNK